jgi:glucokinase
MAFGVGIDLGGTEIKAAAFRLPDGELLAKATSATRDGEAVSGEPAFLVGARDLLAKLEGQAGGTAACLGVSAPGLADAAGVAIRYMPGRLDGLEGLEWGDALGRGRVPVLNDAHAALVGEAWRGAADRYDDVVMLTLGTGVGGAAMCGGTLLRGARGRAGHLGHMTVDFEGAPDICGMPGSLEDTIGNATIGERADGRFATTHELVAAHAGGDAFATEVWLRSLRALAASIASLVNILDPRAVIVGGGIAEAGEQLFAPLEALLREREWQPAGARVELLPAKLGAWAGCYGALHNALAQQES